MCWLNYTFTEKIKIKKKKDQGRNHGVKLAEKEINK